MALLYYIYTGEIQFKQLSSDMRSTNEAPLSAMACSPKSMYRLAEKVGELLAKLLDLGLNTCIVWY